ncbi:hypothetical protein RhiirC2_751787 [Rhizophagus irregularis]|uniref:Uncharacterized protein n=1 Tax=Rhizophagus irregularis TaxID=588596 RepID=A0A2N1ME72_9GLOM|nr:hypothetical protein RhiirC2_762310 [Rhizophagus irregularis]PKK67413.1 hypothetical protein RhiirC2_751787 [Rhizophagus irregularis]
MCLGKELTEGQKGGIIAAKKLGHTDSKTAEVVGCSRSLNLNANFQTIRKELAKENLHSRIPRFSPLISIHNLELLALDVCGVNLPKSFMKTVSQAQSKRVLVRCFGDVFPGLAWVL